MKRSLKVRCNSTNTYLLRSQVYGEFNCGDTSVVFSKEELDKIKQANEKKGIHLLGFVPTSFFKKDSFIRNSIFLFPEEV